MSPFGKYRTAFNFITLSFLFVLLFAGCASEDRSWEKAQTQGSVEAYQTYLNTYPSGKYVQQAKDLIERQQKVWVSKELKEALEATAPEAEYAFYRLTTSEPAPGKNIDPMKRLIICGGDGLPHGSQDSLPRKTLKAFGRLLFASVHQYASSPGMLSGDATMSSGVSLPGKVELEYVLHFLPGNTSPAALWAKCVENLKSSSPGLIVASRKDSLPKLDDFVEVKFMVVTATSGAN